MSHVVCPPREQLADYLPDTLGESVADRVMEHSETCAECDRTIEWLEDASDSVVARLRQPLAGDGYCNHSAYQRLIGALEELKLARIEPAVGTLTATETAPPVNDQLDEYRLLEKLGHGGMGSVYRDLHTKLDRVVALKALSHERVNHNGAVSRFEREMKAVGKLDHPNIVHAYDSGEDDDTHYLVTEFVRGIDLCRLVKEMGPLPIPEACEIICQAASGLDHANRHGMVHHNIKPSNLMLTHSGQVKILNLGLALRQDRAVEDLEPTGEGQLMGTIGYMAPEQRDNSHVVDIRADIYSLGATLYKLLTGHGPFSGKKYASPIKKMRALVQGLVPPIRERRTDIPEGLANVVHQMLAKSPEDRFIRPRDMVELLAAHAAGADLVDLLRRRSLVKPASQLIAKAETQMARENSAPVKPATQLDAGPSATTGSVVSSTSGLIFLWTILFFVTAVSTMVIVSSRQIRNRVIQWVDAIAGETIDDEVDVADVERGDSADGHAHAINAVDELTDTTAWDAEDGRAPLDDALLQETLVITRREESHIDGLLTEGCLPSVNYPAVGCIKPIDARQPAVWMSWSPYAENELLPRSACWKTVEHDVTELQSSEHHDLLTAKTPDTRWYAWDIPTGMEVRPRALLPADMVAVRVSPLGAFVVGRGLNSSFVMLRRSSVRTFDVVADPLLVEAVVNSLDDSLPGVLALSRGNGILQTMHPDDAPPRQLTVMGKTKRLTTLTLSHDGMLLAATGIDYPGGSSVRIGMWQLTTDDALWNTQQWTQ